ncbi:uncharacterized protein LOC120118760 [Hibiscus syriacus]|uniref:uncharacterized protein LOC120118760 n=1 Tax=Hibiscus syriacus TaxID=106335 RepID=UPI001920591F|nr:uncharacterized protein LOC120118760 [Hibiscus syriacus]
MAQMMMAAAKAQDHKHTSVKLRNDSKHDVSLISYTVWEGDQDTKFPRKIVNRDVTEVTHNAGRKNGSVAGLAYEMMNDGKKWVVTWSNPRGEDSTVYVDIVDGDIDWDQIKKDLDNLGDSSSDAVRFGYRAGMVVDDPQACSPIVTAYIEPRT